jgi:hypothetical protein
MEIAQIAVFRTARSFMRFKDERAGYVISARYWGKRVE